MISFGRASAKRQTSDLFDTSFPIEPFVSFVIYVDKGPCTEQIRGFQMLNILLIKRQIKSFCT